MNVVSSFRSMPGYFQVAFGLMAAALAALMGLLIFEPGQAAPAPVASTAQVVRPDPATTTSPVAVPTLDAASAPETGGSDIDDGPDYERKTTCDIDFTHAVPLWGRNGKEQGKLILAADKDAHVTCGYVEMAGKRAGKDQKSITLTLCDGSCNGDGSGASSETTAVNDPFTREVSVKGRNGVDFVVVVVTKSGKILRAASDGAILDGY